MWYSPHALRTVSRPPSKGYLFFGALPETRVTQQRSTAPPTIYQLKGPSTLSAFGISLPCLTLEISDTLHRQAGLVSDFPSPETLLFRPVVIQGRG